MKSRVGERPYLFEQVTQVIDRKEEEKRFFQLYITFNFFLYILPADQGKSSRSSDLQEHSEQGWFGGAVCGGKGGGG